jgi:hypothetical protein
MQRYLLFSSSLHFCREKMNKERMDSYEGKQISEAIG